MMMAIHNTHQTSINVVACDAFRVMLMDFFFFRWEINFSMENYLFDQTECGCYGFGPFQELRRLAFL